MKKRFLSLFLSICMMLSLLPTAALAVTETSPSVIVGGVTLTCTGEAVYAVNNNGAVTTEGATESNYNVKFEVENGTATLTLKDAYITANHTENGISAAIYAKSELTINLVGTNTVVGGGVSGENSSSIGVYCDSAALTITGSGSLTAVGGNASVGNSVSYEDAPKVSEWAIPAMQWANGSGIIQGSDNRLMPKSGATRAHAAAMLQRFCELADQE